MVLSTVGVAVSIGSVWYSSRATVAAEISARSAESTVEVARVTANLHVRPKLHAYYGQEELQLWNNGPVDAVRVHVQMTTQQYGDHSEHGDHFVSSFTDPDRSWRLDRLERNTRTTIALPMSVVIGPAGTEGPQHKKVAVVTASYFREGGAQLYREAVVFYIRDGSLASADRVSRDPSYAEIIRLTDLANIDPGVGLYADGLFQEMKPFPKPVGESEPF